MAFIERSDFVNKFEIHTAGLNDEKLTAYIDRYEQNYLVSLLGVELYELFIADLENPIYETLIDPILFQDNCGQIYNSKGIDDMLLGFVYFEFERDMKVQQTINSSVKIKSNVSERTHNSNEVMRTRYNESIDSYIAIQGYIKDNLSVYPTFKGVDKGYIYF